MAHSFANRFAGFHSMEDQGKPIHSVHLEFTMPPDLSFSVPSAPFNRAVRIAELGQGIPPETINLLYTNRLVPFMIHMAVQAAIRDVRSMPTPFFVQPSAMRHFLKTRTDMSYPITSESFALTDELNKYKDTRAVPNARAFTSLFAAAFRAHKAVIKAAKRGTGIGRHLGLLHSIIDQELQTQPDLKPLVEGWRRFSQLNGPIVYVTGFDHSTGMRDGMGNLYTNDQLSCWYNLGASPHSNDMVMVSLTLAGTGVFAEEGTLDSLVNDISRSFKMMAHGVVGPSVPSGPGNQGPRRTAITARFDR